MKSAASILRNPTIYIAAAVWASFWLLVWIMPRASLFDLCNSLLTAGGAGVLVAYRRGLIEALAIPYRELQRGHLLILGIYCTWGPGIAQRMWAWAWRMLGKPDGMTDHAFLAWTIWVMCSGAALHLKSANAIDGRLPPPVDVRTGIWTAAGVLLFGIVSTIAR